MVPIKETLQFDPTANISARQEFCRKYLQARKGLKSGGRFKYH
jgi:hypothetical protein